MKRLFTCLFMLGFFWNAQAQMIINEVLYDPSNNLLDGDANGDGVYGQEEDSFIEFLNMGLDSFDASGFQIWDDTVGGQLRHTISNGTKIPPGGCLVVFGGGTPTGTFGNAIIEVVQNGTTGMNLNNSGEVIVIKDAQGVTYLTFDSDALSNNPNESYTRNPDFTGGFEQHGTNFAVLFSPGTDVNGNPFDKPYVPTPTYDITFQLDLSQYSGTVNNVFISGSFNAYCSTCDSLMDGNSDNIWDITLTVDSGDMTFLYYVNGAEEQMDAGATCIEDVGGVNYRKTTASATATLDAVCHESCDVCNILVTSISIQGTGGATSIDTKSGTLQMEETVSPSNATDQTVTWSSSDDNIATIDANGLLTAVANGTVTVTATANDGSNVTGTTDITITNQETGLANVNQIPVQVYPNPVQDKVFVKAAVKIQSVAIMNLQGQVIAQPLMNGEMIDISALPAGMYLLHIQTAEGFAVQRIQKVNP